MKNASAKKFSAVIPTDYLLFLPKDYSEKPGKRWPLILFLHGAGERGADVWKPAKHAPIHFLEQHPEFSFIVAAPLCPDGEKWSDALVLKLLDHVCKECAVDTSRIYLTGLSMGGYATFSLATTHPERFAAVAPICGGEGMIGLGLSLRYSSVERTKALRSLPFWVFHGAKDDVVPAAESKRMVKFLKMNGVKEVALTIYPEAAHNSWTETYNNPELYRWFLKWKRNA